MEAKYCILISLLTVPYGVVEQVQRSTAPSEAGCEQEMQYARLGSLMKACSRTLRWQGKINIIIGIGSAVVGTTL